MSSQVAISGLAAVAAQYRQAANLFEIVAVGDTSQSAQGSSRKMTLGELFLTATTAITASTPFPDISQTWNNAAVAFTAIRSNITDTASLSSSLLMDLQVGGVSKFAVRKDGTLITGVAASATKLATARNINGVAVNGTADITVPAGAADLIGTTLAATVVNSSLTSVGILQSPHSISPTVDSGTATFLDLVAFSQSSRTLQFGATAGTGAILDGYYAQVQTNGKSLNIVTTPQVGDKIALVYRDTSGGGAWRSALDFGATNGFATVNVLAAGGTLAIGATATTFAGTVGGITTLGVSSTATFTGDVLFSESSRTLKFNATAGTGAIPDGYVAQVTTGGKAFSLAAGSTNADKLMLAYLDTSGTPAYRSAFDVASGSGFATVNVLAAGGTLAVGASASTFAGTVLTSGFGVGYATGAGGTVTQVGSKTAGVTLNTATGAITTPATALAADDIVSFTLTNSKIAAADVLILNHISGGTIGAYTLNAQCAGGSATINIANRSTGSLSDAMVIQFVLIKGVNA